MLILGGSALGLIVGSFLNVVIHRVPAGRSVVHPSSACPECGTSLSWRENIPVVSWLLQRGRCRHCAAPISPRYPFVELLTAVLFAVVAYQANSWAMMIAWWYLVALTVSLSVIDIDHKRLPDAIVLPSYAVVAVLLGMCALTTGLGHALARAGLGAVILGAVYAVPWFVKPGAMGFGDVKLAPILGAYLAWEGWSQLFVGGLAGFVFGAIFGALGMLVGGKKWGRKIPFGPWMLLGCWFGLMLGGRVAQLYLTMVGLG